MLSIDDRTNDKMKNSIEGAMSILQRYGSPNKLLSMDQELLETDVYHGGNFVYELLKDGVPKEILPILFKVHGSKELSTEERFLLDEMVLRGSLEYSQVCRN